MKKSSSGTGRPLPSKGTKLTGKFKGKIYKAKIVADKNNPSRRMIEYNGKYYPSMTAAAQAIRKHPVNGWLFWKY